MPDYEGMILAKQDAIQIVEDGRTMIRLSPAGAVRRTIMKNCENCDYRVFKEMINQ